MPQKHQVGLTEHNVQHACAELERRLRGGEELSAEVLFAAQPALAADADSGLEVAYTEFVVREQLGQQPDSASWLARFPQWRDDLEQLFQVHRAAGGMGKLDPQATLRLPDDAGLADCPPPTRRFGNYELLEEVGRGGMGVVYRARQVSLNRIVALKMILSGDFSGPEERARFRTEAESAARLQNPNVVQIYEVGEHDGRPFLSLEFVDGGNLDKKLTGTPWSPPDAARLVETLARAMQAAHERGVVHRDLKPANVLLTAEGTPKVTDFGLARRLIDDHTPGPGDGRRTRSGAILGTPAYMAPEQATGATLAAGPAADVYALGAILYELLTGRPPFRAVHVLETLEQIRSREPAPPTRLQPAIPRDLETVCLKCLEKDPGKRYESALALADDLRRFLAGEPIRARPTAVWERAEKWARRRPAIAALLAALVLTTVAGLISVTWLWRQTAGALRREQEQKSQLEAALAANLVALAQRDWLVSDLDSARRRLDDCPPAHRGKDWQYLHHVCHAELLRIDGGEVGFGRTVAWSGDGRGLATVVAKSRVIQFWDAANGQRRFSLEGHTVIPSRIAFFDNDRRLLSMGAARSAPAPNNLSTARVEAKVWDLTAQREAQSFADQIAFRQVPTLTVNGGWLAFGDADAVKVWDALAAREPNVIPAPGSTPFAIAITDNGRVLALSGMDSVIRVWDVPTGVLKASIRTAEPFGDSLTLSPDGRRLVGTRSRSTTVTVWEVATGRELSALKGHTDRIDSATISPDGRHLATAGHDKTIMIWEIATGRELFTFRGHTGIITTLRFSPDGMRLASGSIDGTIRIWDARPPDGVAD
jgi:WD40 repeat protein